jgi:hypothetical protein
MRRSSSSSKCHCSTMDKKRPGASTFDHVLHSSLGASIILFRYRSRRGISTRRRGRGRGGKLRGLLFGCIRASRAKETQRERLRKRAFCSRGGDHLASDGTYGRAIGRSVPGGCSLCLGPARHAERPCITVSTCRTARSRLHSDGRSVDCVISSSKIDRSA